MSKWIYISWLWLVMAAALDKSPLRAVTYNVYPALSPKIKNAFDFPRERYLIMMMRFLSDPNKHVPPSVQRMWFTGWDISAAPQSFIFALLWHILPSWNIAAPEIWILHLDILQFQSAQPLLIPSVSVKWQHICFPPNIWSVFTGLTRSQWLLRFTSCTQLKQLMLIQWLNNVFSLDI